MAAGPELSVAATKTFIASLAAAAAFDRCMDERQSARRGLDRLPERLAAAAELDWSAALAVLADAQPRRQSAAGRRLRSRAKRRSSSRRPAISTPSLQRRGIPARPDGAGVVTLYPILMFMPTDAAARLARARRPICAARAPRCSSRCAAKQAQLAGAAADHPEADAICLIQSFYAMARARRSGAAPMSTGPGICRR